MHGRFEPTLINRVLKMHGVRNPALAITLHRGPCDRPWTAHKKRHLSHSSEIFPAARDTDDKWPFWYSRASPQENPLLRKPPLLKGCIIRLLYAKSFSMLEAMYWLVCEEFQGKFPGISSGLYILECSLPGCTLQTSNMHQQ